MELLEISYEKGALTPKLRFQEFVQHWKPVKLGAITKYTKGFAFKSDDFRSSGIRVIRVSDLGASAIKPTGEKVFVDDRLVVNYDKYLLQSGNIIITTVGSKPELIESSVGRGIFIAKEGEGLLNQNLLKFDNIIDANNGFIFGVLQSSKYRQYIKEIARGNANQANITVEDLLKFKVHIPSLPEQQKIASFLSAVDEKIQLLTRKKELLEQYKKSVMQQLFSGKLRFKDENGKDYPDWEEKKLGEIVISYRLGGNYPNSQEKSKYPLIKMGNLGRGKISINKIEYIPATETVNQADRIQYGDLFFNTRNTLELVGKVAIWNNELPEAYYNSNLMCLKFENNFFMNYRFNSFEGIKELKRLATGTTSVAAIYTKDLLKIKLKVPSLPEQEKIANFLSALDKKIELVSTQITLTQKFKKGLLQQMFV